MTVGGAGGLIIAPFKPKARPPEFLLDTLALLLVLLRLIGPGPFSSVLVSHDGLFGTPYGVPAPLKP
jgi:hypothetical protein